MFVAKFATFLFIIASSLLGLVENKSLFGIGTRIFGDQLLVKDVLQAPPTGWSNPATIRFNYAIPEPISYIEITSEENVLAEVNFSYTNDLVVGTITAVNSTETTTAVESLAEASMSTSNKLEVLILIYGFNETKHNLYSAYVLNRDQNFQGVLEPYDSDEDYYNGSDEEILTSSPETPLHSTREFEEIDDVARNGIDDDDDDDDNEFNGHNGNASEIDDDDLDFKNADKIIELGQRQEGDYKIYETFQTSLTITEVPTEHSIVFYYIDSTFITLVQFTIFDHNAAKANHVQNTPVAEYSHYSPNTLKAIITDHNTTSLFVQMTLYGYKPEDRPVGYQPFLPRPIRGGIGSTAAPMSALQRLKQLMNAQQLDASEETPTTATKEGDDGDDDDDDNDDDEKAGKNTAHNNSDNGGDDSKTPLPLCTSASTRISMPMNLLILMSLGVLVRTYRRFIASLLSNFV